MRGHRFVPVVIGIGVGSLGAATSGATAGVFEVLIIGQASLLAIVLSVSLLSVQVSTTQYAPLLSRVYRNGTFNTIMTKFGISILVALGFRTSISLMNGIGVGVALGLSAGLAAWSFQALFALEEELLSFLNPDPILDELVSETSLSRYRAFTDTHREEGRVARNPLLEIFQITRTAVEQNDNYSALRAVDALEQATKRLIDDLATLPPAEQRAAMESVHRLFDYWIQISRLTAQRGADDVLHALIEGLERIGERTRDETVPEITARVVTALGRSCKHIQKSDRLERHYVERLSTFAVTEQQVVAEAVTDTIFTLADAGVDPAVLGELLTTLVSTGHPSVVTDAFERERLRPHTRRALISAMDRQPEQL